MKPPTLGQLPLAYLDFVVDSKNRKLIPNPEQGDKQMSEEYGEPVEPNQARRVGEVP